MGMCHPCIGQLYKLAVCRWEQFGVHALWQHHTIHTALHSGACWRYISRGAGLAVKSPSCGAHVALCAGMTRISCGDLSQFQMVPVVTAD
jgi:hypothetical protein